MKQIVFYMSGASGLKDNTPRNLYLEIKKHELRISKQRIPYRTITAVGVRHDVTNTQVSRSGAAAGNLMGGAGLAIMLGSKGGTRVNSFLIINYLGADNGTHSLEIMIKSAEKMKHKLDALINKEQSTKKMTLEERKQKMLNDAEKVRKGYEATSSVVVAGIGHTQRMINKLRDRTKR
jgi:hypothetical protein